MGWVGGACVVCLVAGVAVGRCPDEDVVDVAVGAGHGGVRAGQREWRVVVIEDCPGPCRSGVAGGASSREACGHVIGVVGAGVVRLVAGGGIRRWPREDVFGWANRARDRRLPRRPQGWPGLVDE